MLTLVRDIDRLREISTVLVRHGFGEIAARLGLTKAPAGEATAAAASPADRSARKNDATFERIRLVLQDLGPSFIKLGQIVSTRADLLPPGLVSELQKLQEEVPPVPFAAIRAVVEESLGAPLSETFVRFDEQPLAAASIAQVHRAALRVERDGVPVDEEVVVKVQRPGVGRTVASDLDLLRRLAALIERTIPETRLYSPRELVAHFDRAITTELNFTVEAEHAERFAYNFADHPEVRFPRVYRQASSKEVLTLEYFAGCRVGAAVGLGYDGKELARRAVGIVVKMIFEDGFFHADPHPGNIIILGPPTAPVIGLIDLGMVGRLGPELRDRTLDLLIAAARKDSYGVADALYAIGRPQGKVDLRAYRAEVALLAEKYLGKPLKEIEVAALVRDIVQGASRFGIEVPPDFLLVGKALMTLEGIGKQLDPDLDVLGEAAPHVLALIQKRYSPQRLGNDLLRGLQQLGRASYELPLHLREIMDDLRLGRLTLRTADAELPAAATRLGQRIAFGLLTAALILASSNLLAGAHTALAYALLGLGLALGGWLLVDYLAKG
jgi:ubiquinone biosynthesis protein